MSTGDGIARLRALLAAEARALLAVNASDRLWQMPFAAALATGLPLLAGAWFGNLEHGLVASLGGMVFLYCPHTPMSHRMVLLLAGAFGMTASYALGMLSHLVPALMMPMLTFIAIVVTMICRFYQLGPPGSLFFIMAAAIGAYTPTALAEIPRMVGLCALGSLLACVVAFFYSLLSLRLRPADPVRPLPEPGFDFVVFDSVVIGVFVGGSLALAQALGMEKAYWAPISCLAVMQAQTLRALWTKQLQRVLGTALGLALAWALLLLPLDAWRISLVMMLLTFIIEMMVVRHYGLAVLFITPMTILLAEAATLGHGAGAGLVAARFADTVLGCLVGLAGGVCLHGPRFRAVAGGALRRGLGKLSP
ncbi:FUSC family protein [Pseudoduganella namucuonensis]|uniref:Fusaric acid resistance protein-like n=1 Tax=Pseudoduganella namucuonensis TaxID=1035707 RepID=A0A1I7KKD4_9BURK|nr:FUSC family protein [Pseudoduganella namucuonensis]SFU97862.1 Fusaric acid resistance protein-like [Pseudoduganella namucuonensis]